MDKWVFMENNGSTHYEQVDVGIWNNIILCISNQVWDDIANIIHYHSQDSNSVLFGNYKDLKIELLWTNLKCQGKTKFRNL